MGTVTNLAEFRSKKSKAEFDSQVRMMGLEKMGIEDWIVYVNSSEIIETQQAIKRCVEIREDLRGSSLAELFSSKQGYLFTNAFRRATLRMELAGLVERYNLALFEPWI